MERGKEKNRKKVLASAPHTVGKIGWYTLGCRCEGCKEAARTHVSVPRGPRPAGMEVSEYAVATPPAPDVEYTFPERIVLTEEEFDKLERLIENPRPPTAALRALFAVGTVGAKKSA